VLALITRNSRIVQRAVTLRLFGLKFFNTAFA
jgi:hypothetical protein